MNKSNLQLALANFQKSAEELQNMSFVVRDMKHDFTLEEGREMTDRITDAQVKSDRAARAILGMVAVRILREKQKEPTK